MHHHLRLATAVVSFVVVAIFACQSNEPTSSANLKALSATPGMAQGSSKGQEAQCDTVAIFASPTTIAVGSTVQLTGQPFNDHAKALDKATFTWSSLNPSVAAVNSAGLVTGVSTGSAIIRATCSATPEFGAVQIDVQ